WNSHRMDHAVEYLTAHCFETPFDFFQQFGTYWDEKGWSRIGHQLEDLFMRLRQFLQHSNTPNRQMAVGLMKYDYLIKQKYKPRKAWWDDLIDRQARFKIYTAILNDDSLMDESFYQLKLTERDLFKHTM